MLELVNELVISRLPDRLVELAGEIAGCPVALYVVDVDGSRLHRVAGTGALPDELSVPGWFVGPEMSEADTVKVGHALPNGLSEAAMQPLWLRGRAVAVMVCEQEPRDGLGEFARSAAVAVELAERYTDAFASARRRRYMSGASEVQQALLPPRIMMVEGAELAGTILPAYDVAGDWFDQCACTDGARLALADAAGKGLGAAALSAVALGAYRAARHTERSLGETVAGIHRALSQVGSSAFMTAIVSSWEASTATFSWIRCGHLQPLLWHPDGSLEILEGSNCPMLGVPGLEPVGEVAQRRLTAGDRIFMVSDGVTERRLADGSLLGLDGVGKALATARTESASSAVAAVTRVIETANSEPLRDDATILVLRPTAAPVAVK